MSTAGSVRPSDGGRASPFATPVKDLSVAVIRDLTALEGHLPAWESLVASAIEPNPFYEPWALLPALRHLGKGQDVRIVLVYASDPARPRGPRLLCGLFPLERRGRCKELPLPLLSLWRHEFCSLCTPLLRSGYGAQALSAFLDWLASDPDSPSLVELTYTSGDGPFQQLLVDELNRRERLHVVSECFTRAVIRPGADADAYVRGALSGKSRRTLKRLEGRLSRLGRLEYAELDERGDIDAWVDSFLALEANGWKGRLGSAMTLREETRAFFKAVAVQAFRRGRLMTLSLQLGGRPIAQRCSFVSSPGAFAFKTAYDETYARFSPGVHLEIDNIRRLHHGRRVLWMDSCAPSDHFMVNHLWTERRTIQTVLVATGKWPGDFVVSVLPMRAWLRRKLRYLGVLGRRPNF